KHRWYILGKHKRPKRLACYLTLIFEHGLDEQTKAVGAARGIAISDSHRPDMLRIGRFTFPEPQWTPLVSRTAIFQSYLFSFFFISEKAPASVLTEFKKLFCQRQKGAVLLLPEKNRIWVSAGMSSADAFNTHVWVNADYYARKFPQIFSDQ